MSVSRTSGVVVLLTGLALAGSAAAQEAATPSAAESAPAATAVVTVPAVHAVVLPMKGSYMQHPQAFERLGGYLAQAGIAPAGPPFARYFSDPSVGEENLVWEVGFPVTGEVTVEPPYEIRDLPSTSAAVHLHAGPMEELGAAWGEMIQWVMANGYQPAGPATQIFKGDMMTAPEVEMQLPVSK